MAKSVWNSWCSNFESKRYFHGDNKRTFKDICLSNKNSDFFFEIDGKSDVKEIADCIRNMHKQTKQNTFVFNKTMKRNS